MAISVRALLPAIPVPAYQALSAVQAEGAGYTIQRTAPVVLVELTTTLDSAGTAFLPSAPRDGDEVTIVRNADGTGVLTVNAQALRYRGDAVTFQRNAAASTWVLVRPSKGVITTADFASEGYTDINLTGGPRSIDLTADKRFIRLTADPLLSDLTLTLPTTGITPGEWRSFFRVGGGASFRAIITPVGSSTFVLRGKREMVTLVWDPDVLNGGLNPRWQEYYVDRNLFLATESGTTVVYSVITHAGAWVYLTSTSDITIQFSSNLPTPSESIFIVRPHTVARTITLARAASPNDFATFEATGIVAPANTTVTLTVPANAAYSFRTKVVANAGNAAVVYVVEQGSTGGIGDGTITPAKFAIVAPTLIAGGDFTTPTTADATWHEKVFEISSSISPVIVLPSLPAGTKFRIRRPRRQPSPIIIPPTTDGIYIDSAQLGFNRIAPGGDVDVEYNADGTGGLGKATLRGDLMWGGDLTTTDIAGMIDLVDLRRTQGLTVLAGDKVSTWASVGNATSIFSQSSDASRPLYMTGDGTVRFQLVSGARALISAAPVIDSFAGNIIMWAMAYRMVSSGNAGDMWTLESGDTEVPPLNTQLMNPRYITNSRLIIRSVGLGAGIGDTKTDIEMLQNQWAAVAFCWNKTTGRLVVMTNTRFLPGAAGRASIHASIGVQTNGIPNWNLARAPSVPMWIGRKGTGGGCDYFIAGFRLLTNCDAVGSNSLQIRDALIRLLGAMKAELPPGAEV